MTFFDILVVGGGINGCGIARDAAGRGFKVLLAEKADLASSTSSWSTKLIHGGLRYIEHRKFRLVRESLTEREVLLRMAPHVIWPLRFVLPHHQGLRPAWLLRLGLFLYDHLGGRKILPPTRTLDLRSDEAGRPLKDGFSKAFEYSDCWVMDSRLVALNARDAADRGAEVRTRTAVTSLRRDGGDWIATLKSEDSTDEVRARMVVNASGPWIDEVIRGPLGRNDARNVRLVEGSHMVVLVSASVSNWGCYAIVGALSLIARRNLLHDGAGERRLICACVAAGARDGANGQPRLAVDGIDVGHHGSVVELMRAIVDMALPAGLGSDAHSTADAAPPRTGVLAELTRARAPGGACP